MTGLGSTGLCETYHCCTGEAQLQSRHSLLLCSVHAIAHKVNIYDDKAYICTFLCSYDSYPRGCRKLCVQLHMLMTVGSSLLLAALLDKQAAAKQSSACPATNKAVFSQHQEQQQNCYITTSQAKAPEQTNRHKKLPPLYVVTDNEVVFTLTWTSSSAGPALVGGAV